MKTYQMGEMSLNDVRNYLKKNKTILFPYGIVEQHGHHLPLSTDIHNAEMIAGLIAKKLGCIIAPTLNYCFSGGMLPGTVNVKPNHFSAFVTDIIESLTMQGFRNIIVIPGHEGSESLDNLRESLRIAKWTNPLLHDTTLLLLSFEDYSPLAHRAVFDEHDFHAGKLETSMMLAYRPELVHLEKIAMDSPAVVEMLRKDPDFYQERILHTEMREEIPNTRQKDTVRIGVMGDPLQASAEFGRAVLKEVEKNLIPALKKALQSEGRKRI